MKILPWYLAYVVALEAALGAAGHRSRRVDGSAPTPRPGGRPARILVIGGTGGTGREIVSQALKRGYQVTVLARNPDDVAGVDPKLTVIRGDVLHPVSMAEAMKGQEAVVCALGHRQYFAARNLLSFGTKNLIAAMQSHRVARLVCCTSLGIGDSAGRLGLLYTLFVLPTVLPFYFWDKARQERLVAGSDREWVLVRPGRLTDSTRTGRVRHGKGAGSYLSSKSISRADVAAFMLDQLESDTYLRAAVGVVAAQ